uniref:FLYWCH-type domain-containing protein n=1 Tax=Timema tahoe TaxID=61484 RepID=A0A7R9IIE6_9NEOP|nr:unnamed protein product [Timema tahoe]
MIGCGGALFSGQLPRQVVSPLEVYEWCGRIAPRNLVGPALPYLRTDNARRRASHGLRRASQDSFDSRALNASDETITRNALRSEATTHPSSVHTKRSTRTEAPLSTTDLPKSTRIVTRVRCARPAGQACQVRGVRREPCEARCLALSAECSDDCCVGRVMLATGGARMLLQRSLASPASLLAERFVGVLCPACCWRSRRGLHSTATAQARPTRSETAPRSQTAYLHFLTQCSAPRKSDMIGPSRPNYARWMTVYLLNLLNIDSVCPGAKYTLSQRGMSIKRSEIPFSRVPLDMNLEQTLNAEAASRLTASGISRKPDSKHDLQEIQIRKGNIALKCFSDPFEEIDREIPFRKMSTGQDVDKKVSEDLLSAVELPIPIKMRQQLDIKKINELTYHHNEADNRLMWHIAHTIRNDEEKNALVRANDSDILVLMRYFSFREGSKEKVKRCNCIKYLSQRLREVRAQSLTLEVRAQFLTREAKVISIIQKVRAQSLTLEVRAQFLTREAKVSSMIQEVRAQSLTLEFRAKSMTLEIRAQSLTLEFKSIVMALKFVMSEKGRRKLLLDGHLYYKEKQVEERVYWKCERFQSVKCGARVITESDIIILSKRNEHNHLGDAAHVAAENLMVNIRDTAKNTRDTPTCIMASVSSGASQSVVAKLPGVPNMKRTIRNIRMKANAGPAVPNFRRDIVFPDEYKITVTGEEFLMYDSGPQDDRILIFSTRRNLQHLGRSKHWYADGTFKTVTPLFEQLYTIHGFEANNSIPLVYALLADKRQGTYSRLLRKVKELEPASSPQTFMTDFEIKYLSKSVLGKAVAPSQLRSGAGKTDVFEFKKVLPKVVQDLTDSGSYLDVPAATKRLAKVRRLLDEQLILQYNVTGGKKNRGLGVVVSYRMLASEEDLTAENLELAHLMGWAMEMLHGSLLMTQDSLDQVETRRGKPCWYLTPQTTPLVAINDANLLVTAIYQLLKTHFKNQPYYVDVIELFQDVCHKATMGQVIDIETRADKTLQQFTMERYKAITKYKTVYHTFQMPAGIQDIEIHRQAKTILMEMGQFYQVMVALLGNAAASREDMRSCAAAALLIQPHTLVEKQPFKTRYRQAALLNTLADYMNCYMEGDEGFGARSGSDIEDGKCTWLAVVALQRASNQQKIHLQYNRPGLKSRPTIMGSPVYCDSDALAQSTTDVAHPTEIRTSISPSSTVGLNTTSALANYATEAGNKTLPPDTDIASDTDDGTVLELVDKRCGPKKF